MPDTEAIQALERLADLVERRLAPALERIAAALERGPRHVAEGEGPELGTIFEAARDEEGRGDEGSEGLGPPTGDRGGGESVEVLTGRIEAAHRANDAEEILAIRDELAGRLEEGPRGELDRRVVGWLMALVQQRLRVVPMPPDVAFLAGQVAERFPESPEGASLLRALPTLRRSAGLCPRCARPYRGVEAACPECLLAPTATVADPSPPAEAEADPGEAGPSDGEAGP